MSPSSPAPLPAVAPSLTAAPAPSSLLAPLPPRSYFTHVSRRLLARLLAPFAPLLAERGFSLATLDEAPADDRAAAHALHDRLDAIHAALSCVAPSSVLAGPPATMPASADLASFIPLFDRLAAVYRVASPAGREALIKLDTARVLPARAGAEDLAATAYLDHPALFAQVRVAAAADAIKGFVMFEAAPHAEPAFDREAVEATARSLGEWFESKHRTAVCEIHQRHRPGERHFEITHGKPPTTQELIDESLAMKVVTQVSTARSYAIYYEESRVLAVHALEFIKDGVRRSFGRGCGTGDDFFAKSQSLLDTGPLVDLDATLAPDPELGVMRVEVREITVTAPDRSGASYWPDKGDVRESHQNDAVRAALARTGARVAHVKLAIELARVKRVQIVEIFALRSQLVYDRREPLVEKTLLAFLTRRGVWLGGRKSEAPEEGAPDVQATAS